MQDSFSADRQHEFKYGAGCGSFPSGRTMRDSSVSWSEPTFSGPTALRRSSTRCRRWIYLPESDFCPSAGFHLSGAYRSNLRRIDPELLGIPRTGRHGWFLQIVLQRKINRPPSVECGVDQDILVEGDSTTVRVTVSDPDDEILGISWDASSGRITLNGDSAIFDSTGLPAGQYTVSTKLDDGESTSGCTVHILVRKKNLP